MDRLSRQKIKEEILELNHVLDQMDLTDIYRTLHQMAAKYTFFSSTYETFSKADHVIGKEISCRKFYKSKMLQLYQVSFLTKMV